MPKKKQNKRTLGFDVEEEKEEELPQKKSAKTSKNIKKNSKGKKGKNENVLPKTVQDTIPYIAMYTNGVCELSPGIFSKTYKIEDVNFKIASDDEQFNIFSRYEDLLNTFDSDIKMQLVIYNRNMNDDSIEDKVLLPLKKDALNEYRVEYNNMLKDKMKEGRNNISKEKYISLTISSESLDDAFSRFAKIDAELSAAIKRINQQETLPMTAQERLELLSDIYSNTDEIGNFYRKAEIDGHNVNAFDFSSMGKMGLTTKDLIGPASFEFSSDYFKVGDRFGCSLFVEDLPTFMSANVLEELTDVNFNILVSISYNRMKPDKAMSLLRNQMVNINANVIDAQKKAIKSGYDPSLISPELLRSQQECQDLMDDITKRNQSLILTTILVTVFGDTKEELNKNIETLKGITGKYLFQLRKLTFQQEKAFDSTLPLGRNDISADRLLTTESAAIFIPFSTQELSENHGMYYGLNAVSKNLILFNRKNAKNSNGMILGTPGSGKSFSAKREMINVILNTDDDIYVIDPEREYTPLAKLLGGTVVSIAAGGKTYLNPMDMDINYGEDDEDTKVDPISMKCDFISGLCETMAGDGMGLTSIQKSIIDRCVRIVYQPYMDHMKEVQKVDPDKTCDMAASPTLREFYDLLSSQPEYEAQALALSLERFCIGSLDIFAHHTNVQRTNRFIVYDVKDIGDGLKELGLQVCLNAVWNQIIENKKRNRYTWFYLDEMHLLIQTDSSAIFLRQVYKRARKWQGIPTGMTQNVGDILASREANTILLNCEFIMMLNQSQVDKMQLASMLNISPTQLSYVTNADPGQGLIFTGKSIVPFIDKFPMNTKLYKVMTTRPDDLGEFGADA